MIEVRKIKKSDLELIMNWRMRPDITRWLYTDPVLTMEKQLQWYEKLEQDESSKHWMIVIDGVRSGVISITDMHDDEGVGGLYIAELDKRSIINVISVTLGMYKYCFEVKKLKKIRNEVFEANKGVVRINQMCSNVIDRVEKNAIEKNGEMYDVVYMYTNPDKYNETIEKLKGKYEEVVFTD